MAETEGAAPYPNAAEDPEYQAFLAQRRTAQAESAVPVTNTGTASLADIERIVAQALDRQAAEHKAEIKALRDELSARTPVTAFPTDHPIPVNAGGIGQEVRETWSYHDQTLANAGIHPLQLESAKAGQEAA
jgi:hypothetical protein